MTFAEYRIQHRASTVSTMDDARQAAQEGAADGLVILADRQTGGRGRRGRSWISPPGNLYASLLLRPGLPQAELGLFSFAASLAVSKALPDSLDRDRVKLKWPNDVLADDAKIAGILLESCNTPQGLALIVGMGVNMAQHPKDAPYPVTSLDALGYSGQALEPGNLLRRILSAMTEYRHGLEHGDFSGIRAAWLAQASGLGGMIVVRLPSSEMAGQFTGIDEKGHLLLRHPTGILQKIAVGDVFMPRHGAG